MDLVSSRFRGNRLAISSLSFIAGAAFTLLLVSNLERCPPPPDLVLQSGVSTDLARSQHDPASSSSSGAIDNAEAKPGSGTSLGAGSGGGSSGGGSGPVTAQRSMDAAPMTERHPLLPQALPVVSSDAPLTLESIMGQETLLCEFENNFGGTSQVHSMRTLAPPVDGPNGKVWLARRSIRMTGYRAPTNVLECEVREEDFQPGMCMTPSLPQANPPVACPYCPCNVETGPRNRASTYITRLCMHVSTQGCRYKNGVIVGFGIGTLSICLAQNCPHMKLTTVDIDPGAPIVGKLFFGFRNQTTMHVGDAGEFFNAAAEKGEKFDFVAVDCFIVAKIPEVCRSDPFFEAIGKTLNPKGGLYAQNTFKPREPWEANIRQYIGLNIPKTNYFQLSQWYMVQHPLDSD